MKLFLAVAVSLSVLALITHFTTIAHSATIVHSELLAQNGPPSYPPPPPQAYPPPPPPEMAPPTTEIIPPAPPPAMSPALPPRSEMAPPSRATETPLPPEGLQPQHQGDIVFISGGVGDQDRADLRAMAGQYNLHLLFAGRSGEFLAGIGVTVRNAQGRPLLDTIADGPILYAKLPPGRYRVTASNDGQSITRDMTVPASGTVSQDFSWAQSG